MIGFKIAGQQDHEKILKLAKTSKYTKDFSNAVMFSSPAAYAKGWIRIAENEAGEVVGFTCVRHKVREPKTVLYFLNVREDVRKQNVAKMLLDLVMSDSPHKTMQLNVMKDNEAKGFYDRQGFQVTGEAINGQAHQMEKVWK